MGAPLEPEASGDALAGQQLKIINPAPINALKVTQQANAPASTSSGGAVNVDNSLSTGAGLVVFSSQAAPTGRLLVARASDPGFAQTVGYFENAGTGHAIHGNNTFSGTNATGSAGNFTSTNPGASCVQIGGVETGRGSLKITHTAAGGDANASGLSIDLQGTGTAAQGIHIDSVANGTTGALLDMRNNGNQLFKFGSDSSFSVPVMTWGNGGPTDTIGTGSPLNVVVAQIGSTYRNLSGGAGQTFWVKESGNGLSTGWVAK